MNNRSRRARIRNNQGEDDEEEIGRYKENFAKITRIKTDIYSGLPVYVDVRADNLLVDPVDYELEHKRRQIWTVKELKIFYMVLSECPKLIWIAHSRLPYKTSKEIQYFSQAFECLMRFEPFQQESCELRHKFKHHKD